METTNNTRTRFAPSPTGELHPGNVRVAILNWLFARHQSGAFVIRIEDTDVDRNVEGAEVDILEALRDLGLEWDEGPDVGGPYGPYKQSERAPTYARYSDALLDSGKAYSCYCTPEELANRKKDALASGGAPRYDGRCRDLSDEERKHLEADGRAASIRFRVPAADVEVHDLVRGAIEFDADAFGDFVIVKSDGFPTYNFAVVVDDTEMKISHVIRGVGHLANTPRQQMLYDALGVEPPVFVHVPHVLSPDGSSLSKRHGARSLREYLDAGFHPGALINYLSLLSWSSKSGEEVLPPERLIEEIDLARIGSSDARLDPEKLEWLSGEYIRRMPAEELASRLSPYLRDAGAISNDEATAIAAALQLRINTFGEAAAFIAQLRPSNPMQWSTEAEAELAADGVEELFRALRPRLASEKVWSGSTAMGLVREVGKEVGLKGRALLMPVRAGITGATVGPELPDVFAIQGRERVLRVIDQTLEKLANH